MSRCFPYPPPGYVCKSATGDSLIGSIKSYLSRLRPVSKTLAVVNPKIESEKEKAKQERKEQKRREKEVRKKEKKEKKREKEKLKSIQNTEGAHKRKRDGDGLDKSMGNSFVNSTDVNLPAKKELQAEQLERSSLSEEHGQPVLAESLCYSSDDSQSNTKRSRIEQSPSNGKCTSQGKVFRFRLKRREERDVHSVDNPSTSGRTGTTVTQKFESLPVKDEHCMVPSVTVPREDIKGSIPMLVEQLAPAAHVSSSVEKGKEKPKSAYEAILGGWVPPPVHFDAVNGDDDEQWLFSCKTEHITSLGAHSNGFPGPQCSSVWPRATLLPKVDLCVLPFTVPF